jgi:hypothetical protein
MGGILATGLLLAPNGTPPAVPTLQFPDAADCERANRAAVFHAGIHGGIPCLEVDGVLVFAYLDAQVGAVRVSVHLDSAPDHLVRPADTVPLRVKVEDTIVLDDSNSEGAPRPPLLSAADAVRIQREPILAAALAASVLRRCPACQWDNPAAATCCEGPGPAEPSQSAAGVEAGLELRER